MTDPCVKTRFLLPGSVSLEQEYHFPPNQVEVELIIVWIDVILGI
jgi:hypothetical protein